MNIYTFLCLCVYAYMSEHKTSGEKKNETANETKRKYIIRETLTKNLVHTKIRDLLLSLFARCGRGPSPAIGPSNAVC